MAEHDAFQIGDGVIATDPNGQRAVAQQDRRADADGRGPKPGGRPIWEVFRVINEHPETRRRPGAEGVARARGDAAEFGRRCSSPATSRNCRSSIAALPIVGFDGSLAGAVLIFRDVTERRRTAQRQSMLVGELNHRVKNALAIVQSLVQASLRQATSAPAKAMAETLAERLQALHRAHDLLLESQWSGASLKAMVEREMDPYRREGGPRIMIKGPDVLLPPQCTSFSP